MTEPREDKKHSEVPVWSCLYHTGSASDLTVQPFVHVVGVTARPVFVGKITIQCYPRLPSLPLSTSSPSARRPQRFAFSQSTPCFLSEDCLAHFCTQFRPFGHNRKTLWYKCKVHHGYFISRNTLHTVSSIPMHLSPMISFKLSSRLLEGAGSTNPVLFFS